MENIEILEKHKKKRKTKKCLYFNRFVALCDLEYISLTKACVNPICQYSVRGVALCDLEFIYLTKSILNSEWFSHPRRAAKCRRLPGGRGDPGKGGNNWKN